MSRPPFTGRQVSQVQRRARRQRWPIASLALALWLCASCQRSVDPESNNREVEGGYDVELRWTAHGIPHVRAPDLGSLGFGIGWVKANAGLCTFARAVLTVRGESARYFGADDGHRESDVVWRALLDDALVERSLAEQSAPARELLDGMVAGYNRYLRDYPEEHRPVACRDVDWVIPLVATDVARLLLASGLGNAMPRLGPAMLRAQPPGQRATVTPLVHSNGSSHFALFSPAGGNALAIGAERSATSAGILYSRTQAPWNGPGRGLAMQLTVLGKLDVFGSAELAGGLLPHSGFNATVAWARSTAPTQRATVFALALVAGAPTRYRFGTELRTLRRQNITIDVRNANGDIRQETHPVFFSHLGPVIATDTMPWTASTAYTYADANLRPERSTETLLRVAGARDVAAIAAALRSTQGDGRFASTAVDRNGDVLYVDVGRVPNVDYGFLQRCGVPALERWADAPVTTLRGVPDCVWQSDPNAASAGLMAPSRMPALQRRDTLLVAGDGHWLIHPTARLEGYSPMFGGEGTSRSLRARARAAELAELPGRIDSTQLQAHASRAAEPLLSALRNDMNEVCKRSGGRVELANGNPAEVAIPCAALAQWDGRFVPTSRGALLWAEFWSRAQRVDNLWATPYRLDAPLSTPAGLNLGSEPVREGVLRALVDAFDALAARGIAADAPLGSAQFVEARGKRIPVGGAADSIGANSVLETERGSDVRIRIRGGDSYVQTVGWRTNGTVQASIQLPHGQAAEDDSPDRFSSSAAAANGQWTAVPFTSTTDSNGVLRRLHLLDERTP